MNLRRIVRKKELIDLTLRLIRIPTENPPGNEKGAALFLKPLLSEMGFRVRILLSPNGRYNLIAERRWGKAGRSLIFNGHLDVVPAGDLSQWQYPPFEGKRVKGKIYGRGTSDMKGGIASFIHAISMIDRAKIALDRGSIVLHLVSDEESHGHQGTGFLSQRGLIRGDAAIVGEPTYLDAVIAHKGALWLRVSTFGKSAHGSRPGQGINAIEKMMNLITCLNSIPLQGEHPLLGKPTINIGAIRGGTKINMVPDQCDIGVDRRMLPGEKKEEVLKEIKKAFCSLQSRDPLLRYRIEEIDHADPSETSPQEEIVRVALEAISEVRGKRPSLRGSSGFMDSRFYINQFRIPTLIFGPGGMDQSHTANESVEVDALVQAAEIYALTLVNYLSLPRH